MSFKTISKKTRIKQSLDTASFRIEFNYEHEEGKTPDMITAKAQLPPPAEGEPPAKPLVLDVSFYPGTNNLQIVCHNTPADFDPAKINEVLRYF